MDNEKKHIYFLLDTFRDNLFPANQFANLSISLLIQFEILIDIMGPDTKEIIGPVSAVSSAYVMNVNLFDTTWISFTYIMKSSGPKMKPCGTPIYNPNVCLRDSY